MNSKMNLSRLICALDKKNLTDQTIQHSMQPALLYKIIFSITQVWSSDGHVYIRLIWIFLHYSPQDTRIVAGKNVMVKMHVISQVQQQI